MKYATIALLLSTTSAADAAERPCQNPVFSKCTTYEGSDCSKEVAGKLVVPRSQINALVAAGLNKKCQNAMGTAAQPALEQTSVAGPAGNSKASTKVRTSAKCDKGTVTWTGFFRENLDKTDDITIGWDCSYAATTLKDDNTEKVTLCLESFPGNELKPDTCTKFTKQFINPTTDDKVMEAQPCVPKDVYVKCEYSAGASKLGAVLASAALALAATLY